MPEYKVSKQVSTMYVCMYVCIHVCMFNRNNYLRSMRFRWCVCNYLRLFLCVYQVVIRLWRFLGGRRRHGNSDWLQYCARLGHVDSSPSRRDRTHSQAPLQVRYCYHTGLLSRRLFSRSLLGIYIHNMHGLACGYDWVYVCMYECAISICMYVCMYECV
jgi:hypothetical protein